jgi:hypothetical protein
MEGLAEPEFAEAMGETVRASVEAEGGVQVADAGAEKPIAGAEKPTAKAGS